ncbi:MAG TPA: glucose-6-phosphate isomerase [Steroidobacteraceae bacterium]|nr:glucose-6-phosphate isomerase [Steroidobacteraceae bacterium]
MTAFHETIEAHARRLGATRTADLFAADPDRFTHCSRDFDGLLLDFSRQRIDADALQALIERADAVGLRGRIEALFSGAVVNESENRAALHTLLRVPAGVTLLQALVPLHEEVLAVRAQCAAFVRDVHGGRRTGSTGGHFTDVVNIGIGGSDLGPAMAVAALKPFHSGHVHCHFVSNVDGTQFADLAEDLDPQSTLFIICSKTFTTQETIANARRARAWLVGNCGEAAVARQFAAVSVNAKAMDEFGISDDARFAMWDWVGGRYSMWSAVGLAIELAIGTSQFEAMLAGAHAMDEHFRSTAWTDNLPVLLGLLAIWNRNALGCASHAVLPYTQRLARLPAYLQQLEMESLGKQVTRDGKPVHGDTGAVIWGEAGSNGQHSFFQLLHQGTASVSLDFLLPVSGAADRQADELVIANCLAQAQALMAGHESVEPHRRHAGSRPLTLLAFPQLDPAMLGRLVALYEHKVFVESVLWNVNPFDQWGVELGKKLCNELLPLGERKPPADLSGIAGWIARHR